MINKESIVYLAVPYSPTKAQVHEWIGFDETAGHPYYKKEASYARRVIMQDRAAEADSAAAWLMQQGYVVLSPISHSHGIAQHMPPEARTDHDLWMKQDKPFVRAADVMVILTLDGWRESRGIRHEVREFARKKVTVQKVFGPLGWKYHGNRNVFFLNRVGDGYEISRRPE